MSTIPSIAAYAPLVSDCVTSYSHSSNVVWLISINYRRRVSVHASSDFQHFLYAMFAPRCICVNVERCRGTGRRKKDERTMKEINEIPRNYSCKTLVAQFNWHYVPFRSFVALKLKRWNWKWNARYCISSDDDDSIWKYFYFILFFPNEKRGKNRIERKSKTFLLHIQWCQLFAKIELEFRFCRHKFGLGLVPFAMPFFFRCVIWLRWLT